MSAQDRRDALWGWLRGAGATTVEQAAERFEVSERTLHRDLDYLRSKGVHIATDRGRGGGIYLDPERSLPPVRLGLEEVLGLVVAVSLATQGAYLPLAGPAQDALSKIVATLPKNRAKALSRLLARVFVGAPASRHVAASVDEVGTDVLGSFERAFSDSALLRFKYRKASGRRTSRLVEPHGLLLQTPAWYLLALDRERGATRTFRLDRMSQLVVESETFRPKPQSFFASVLKDVHGVRSLTRL